jgi:hypothetical protein
MGTLLDTTMENGWDISAVDDLRCRCTLEEEFEPSVITLALTKLGTSSDADGDGCITWKLNEEKVAKVTAHLVFRSQGPSDKVLLLRIPHFFIYCCIHSSGYILCTSGVKYTFYGMSIKCLFNLSIGAGVT